MAKSFHRKVLFAGGVITNKDVNIVMLNLVCSDLTYNGGDSALINQKQGKVKEFHELLAPNAGLAKSPTRIDSTQSTYIFMSNYAVFKLVCLKIMRKTSHFAYELSCS